MSLGSAGLLVNGLLADRFGRVHRSLRVSITDVCNLRCQYCMSDGEARFLPNDQTLRFDEITTFIRAVCPLGVSHVRITGGEPLVRPGVSKLVRSIAQIPGIDDLGVTTNGMFLVDQLPDLVEAGLQRINISLDTLSDATFRKLARRDGLDRVLAGIEAAIRYPELSVKLNALVLRDVNLGDVLALVEFAVQRKVTLRFIEFMPLDASRQWNRSRMVSGDELRTLISQRFGRLTQIDGSSAPSQPSCDYRLPSGAILGFIDSVSSPFCSTCDRLRLSSDGKVRNCLFGHDQWDVRDLLSGQYSDEAIRRVVRSAIAAKRRSHGIDGADFRPPDLAMYQIGG